MKKSFKHLGVLFLGLCFVGCFNRSDDVELEATFIDLIGMEKEEVLDRFGKPKRTLSLTGASEELIWDGRDSNYTFVINLHGNKVERVIYAVQPGNNPVVDPQIILSVYSAGQTWEGTDLDVYVSIHEGWIRDNKDRIISVHEGGLYIWDGHRRF